MGSINSKAKSSSDAYDASPAVARDSPDPVLQHGSSTGDNDPPQGEWILVHTSNKKAPFQKTKVSAAYESVSNASGHKGHITNTTRKTIKEALKSINNIFLLLSDEEMLPNSQKEVNKSFCDDCKDDHPHSGLYACKTNNKTINNNDKYVPHQKKKKDNKNNNRNVSSKKRNHKGNKYSDKPYSKPLNKNLKRNSPRSSPYQQPKLKTKTPAQSKATLKAKIAICKQRKAAWMKQNKGHRFSAWNQRKLDKKGLNLTDLDDIV